MILIATSWSLHASSRARAPRSRTHPGRCNRTHCSVCSASRRSAPVCCPYASSTLFLSAALQRHIAVLAFLVRSLRMLVIELAKFRLLLSRLLLAELFGHLFNSLSSLSNDRLLVVIFLQVHTSVNFSVPELSSFVMIFSGSFSLFTSLSLYFAALIKLARFNEQFSD